MSHLQAYRPCLGTKFPECPHSKLWRLFEQGVPISCIGAATSENANNIAPLIASFRRAHCVRNSGYSTEGIRQRHRIINRRRDTNPVASPSQAQYHLLEMPKNPRLFNNKKNPHVCAPTATNSTSLTAMLEAGCNKA